MWPIIAGEVMKRSSKKRAERCFGYNDDDVLPTRKKRFYGAMGLAACVALGVTMSLTEGDGEEGRVEITANGGTGKVFSINRTVLETHVTGFKTEADSSTAERRQTDRTLVDGVPVLEVLPGVKAIPAPDIIANVRVDNLVIDSNLCYSGGRKAMEQSEIDGVTHIHYELDPADLRVCSAEDVFYRPDVHHDGNFIQNINDLSAEWNKLFSDENTADKVAEKMDGIDIDTSEMSAVEKANAIKETVRKVAVNAAIHMVNRKCAPLVLDETEDDLKKLVAESIAREGEVVTVTLKKGDGHVFEGSSELDEFFERIKAEESENTKWDYDGGNIGECTLAADFEDIKAGEGENE